MNTAVSKGRLVELAKVQTKESTSPLLKRIEKCRLKLNGRMTYDVLRGESLGGRADKSLSNSSSPHAGVSTSS